jgi:hypothetical protein
MIKSFLSIAFLIATLLTTGQNTAKTEVEIRKLEQTVVMAILNADTTTLKQVWAPEFLVNNPRNDISANRNAVLQTQKSGIIDYSTFERVIEQMQFQKETVITMGHETFVSRNDIPEPRQGKLIKDDLQISG